MPVSSLRLGRPAGVGQIVALTLAAESAAQETPAGPDERFDGLSRVDKDTSQDRALKIALSAPGPDQLKGGGGRDEQLPSGGGEGEMRGFQLRQRLVAASEAIQDEIELEPGEFKVISPDDDIRIFYLTRKHTRQRDDGVKIVFDRVPE